VIVDGLDGGSLLVRIMVRTFLFPLVVSFLDVFFFVCVQALFCIEVRQPHATGFDGLMVPMIAGYVYDKSETPSHPCCDSYHSLPTRPILFGVHDALHFRQVTTGYQVFSKSQSKQVAFGGSGAVTATKIVALPETGRFIGLDIAAGVRRARDKFAEIVADFDRDRHIALMTKGRKRKADDLTTSKATANKRSSKAGTRSRVSTQTQPASKKKKPAQQRPTRIPRLRKLVTYIELDESDADEHSDFEQACLSDSEDEFELGS
jgi:hypothetical protein